MQLRWTTEAASDLERITNHLFENTPEHAERIVRTIYQTALTVTRLPFRGRSGKKPGTRELVLPSLPYIIIYRVRPEVVYISRILHGALRALVTRNASTCGSLSRYAPPQSPDIRAGAEC